MVSAALRRDLPLLIIITPVFPYTPGTACGLTRGWCDPTAVGALPQLGTRDCPSSLKRSRQGEPPSSRRTPQDPKEERPRRRQGKHHHQHLILTGSQSGTSQLPSPAMSTPVKHPQTFQRPQHPQPPSSATNHNSGGPNLLDQAKLGRLLKPARSSISKESTTRSRRDNFSVSNLSFTGLQRSHRDYFSGSPSGQLNKNVTLTDPYREARTAVGKRSGPAQTPPCAALPDVHLDIELYCRKLPPLAAFHVRTVLLWCWTSLEAPQSRWSPIDAQIHPAEDLDLPGEVTSGQGPTLPLRHASPGSNLLPPADGVNSRTAI